MIKEYYKILKKYFSFVKGVTKHVVFTFITSILGHGSSILIPVAISQMIKYATDGAFDLTYQWLFILFGIYIFHYLSWTLNYHVYKNHSKYLFNYLQDKIVNKVMTYDENFTNKVGRGRLLNVINTDIYENIFFIDNFVETIIGILKLIILMIIIALFNIYLFLFILLFLLVYIGLYKNYNAKKAKYYAGQKKYLDQIGEIFSSVLSGLKEIKIFNISKKIDKRIDIVQNKYIEQYEGKRKYDQRIDNGLAFFNQLVKVVIYGSLFYLMMIGRIDIAALILLVSYYEQIVEIATYFMNLDGEIKVQIVSINRVYNIINYNQQNPINFGLCDNDYIQGTIEFENVSFSYNGKLALDNISFQVKPNQVTAIVGAGGSGKSTICNILLRLYKIDSGLITIDSQDIYNYSKKVYASNVSVVNQKSFVFNMSIKNNLSMVNSNNNKIIEVCQKVGIHDFIMTLPKKYNTILNDDALVISSGQKQLISLARALLSKSEIIILDDVTNFLDSQTAKKIERLIFDLKYEKTIIMITHKPELMKKADNIIVLDKGKIVGIGKHKDLIIDNKYYQDLQKKK